MKESKRHRNAWTQEENKRLKFLVEEKKMKSWVLISNFFINRSNKDCRDHYIFHLSPNIVKRKWTENEEQFLLEKFNEIGPKWVKMATFFDKRSPNDLKNRVKLIKQRKKPLRNSVLNLQKHISNSTQKSVDHAEKINNPILITNNNTNTQNLNQNNIFDQDQFCDFFHDIGKDCSSIDNMLNIPEYDEMQSIYTFDSLCFTNICI